MNTLTLQFVSATAQGVRTFCRSGLRTGCVSYVKIGITEYSGDFQVHVSLSQFALAGTLGARYAPATARQATRVVRLNNLLPDTVLQPDDDGDFASGTLVFIIPHKAGRLSLLWQGVHVATFVKTARGTLYESR